MSSTSRPSSVTYRAPDEGYFEKRQLKRSAGFWGIWGLGVAAVISGEFSGWNFGTASAGFGGMAIATAIVIVMYFCLLFSIGEMSAAMPHTGGAYSFARAALGPWGGFVTGLAESIEYVMTTAVVVFFAGQYADLALQDLTGASFPQPVWWAVLYLVFLGVNILGAAIGFRLAIVVSILSIAILAVFVIVAFATGGFQVEKLFDVAPSEGNSTFLPGGVLPILLVMPFAMWFFLGIEELPLAAEEAHEPQKVIPKAGFWGLITLLICAIAVFVVNTGVLGAKATAVSGQPLIDGFDLMVPKGLAGLLALFALVGLLASLQGIMFAYGRNMYSLSRAGYYPRFLSLTGGRQTPWVALIVGAVIGFVALVIVQVAGGATGVAGAVVLNIAVWGAVISYMSQALSFLVLRRRFPNAERPYRSPVGAPGAVIAGVIALAIFIGFFFTGPGYLIAIAAIAVVYVIGLLLFAVVGRHNLVLSPEEEYAMTGGLHRDPDVEAYDGTVPAA
ncbi:amino acid permease [Amnibacterium kyonggiense]|uniref:Ethanolamine:proton symporter (EAT family) n=1 Tax=Amnibacterium kyonggiense TaxID=595671 RepID=A0A4R7FJD2_9MICO|nr:amino acid permease [Amnibacterium kyonggiense]TDS76181.1 ethanolamine:proton symporter (EAT family) [Amnibacterium kyonggiense]